MSEGYTAVLRGAQGGTPALEMGDEEGDHDLSDAGDINRPPLQQKLVAVDDIVLLKAVNYFRPWTAPVGTSNGIMKVFDDIALHGRSNPAFGLKKPGTAVRTRFTTLVNQYRADQCQSMRKSGTVEEYEEREVLLQNIVTMMDDWKDVEDDKEKEKSAKQRGVESSGAMLRRLAMGELDEGDSSEDSDEVGATATDAIEGSDLSTSRPTSSPTSPRSSSCASSAAVQTTPLTTSKKRASGIARGRSSGRKKKITQLEQLGVVTQALAGAIMGTDGEETAKYAYKAKRMELEREIEEKRCIHEAEEAEQRRIHERQMKEQRLKAEDERDKRMHEFILKILAQQKSS